MLNIGPMELILILLVALIFVGPKRLPELGRTIGKSLRELRKAQDEVRSTLNLVDEPPRAPRRTPPRSQPRRASEPDEEIIDARVGRSSDSDEDGGPAPDAEDRPADEPEPTAGDARRPASGDDPAAGNGAAPSPAEPPRATDAE